ncbi:tryptophan halogenase family protein [uncultured Ferrimonas sp.]|uniref:tryptophan halogenase family protein n=1 Tax=uncultured Ferrimonas sp. TaxID=432640 RepID=UPI002631BE5F|nr:tryptophan halogenase family protein [uncultured Ferrimonas sp.]
MKPIKQVMIAGGGSAGWMTAALLCRTLGQQVAITLVESEQLGTIGVGEAAIPPLHTFNQALGLDEAEFMSACAATVKLGIQFEGWGQANDSYMHAFGNIGKQLGLTPFHQHWLRFKQQGHASSLWDFSLNYQAAKHNQFGLVNMPERSPIGPLIHAYHFDAGRYAQFLRQYSEQRGVRRIEGRISAVAQHGCGNIAALQLQDGQRLEADLFIDCSGFRALLIGDALGVGYHNWQHWLPCDRAIAVPSRNSGELKPYTRSIAHQAGWQWRIPLQHRQGNGIVYSSQAMSDDDAEALLLASLEGEPLAPPRRLQFTTGRRDQVWSHNCIAIGLSSGFLEPLESTSIHLIQSAVQRLVKLFPASSDMAPERQQFNREAQLEMEQIRDFIILHYHLNQRHEPFWQRLRQMALPASLQQKLALFANSGRLVRQQDELFTEVAWLQVMIGQNLQPQQYHPLADGLTHPQLSQFMMDLASITTQLQQPLPTHQQFIQRYCRAKESQQ